MSKFFDTELYAVDFEEIHFRLKRFNSDSKLMNKRISNEIFVNSNEIDK